MNNKIHVDLEVIKLLYFKYKAYILPVIAIVFSCFIFFQFIIGEIQNFLAVKNVVAANEQTLAQLTQNYNTLAGLQEVDIQTLLGTANRALPQVKDFAGILNAISAVAGLSGVTVNDYSFQIGDLSNIGVVGTTNQTVQLSLTIKGTSTQAREFLKELSQALPLSEVVSVNMGDATATSITANFFYSPPTKISFIDTNPLPLLSASQKKLLGDLEKNATFIPVASSSASSQ